MHALTLWFPYMKGTFNSSFQNLANTVVSCVTLKSNIYFFVVNCIKLEEKDNLLHLKI